MRAKGSFGLDIRVVAVGDGDLNSNVTNILYTSIAVVHFHLNFFLVVV